VEGAWTPEKGQDAAYPRLSIANANANKQLSTFWLRDASYIRLKSLELGYTFRGGMLDTFGMNNLRVYVNGYNLLTFSELLEETGTDPEEPGGKFKTNNYPIMETYNVGAKFSF
jgi:hypothetical protein